MQAPKNRPVPPRPRPYNRTTATPRPKRILEEWELVSLDDPDILVEEISEVRARIDVEDIVALPPLPSLGEWQDLELPLPPPRPRPRR